MHNLKKRILVVDDDPKITRQIRFNLELTGEFQVQEENRATHALIAARGFLPDLILLDVIMPGIEGGDLASEIREIPRFREVPIIFLTAAVTRGEVQQHPRIGGERFLAKPISFTELVDCLHEELQKASHRPVENQPAEDTIPRIAY